MKDYIGYFTANNQSLSGYYEFDTLAQAKKDMKEIVVGNHFQQAYNKSWYIIRTRNGRTITKETYSNGKWHHGITF